MDGFSNLHGTRVHTDAPSSTTTTFRFVAVGVIFLVSATASSFPSLAKHVPRLEPPEVVFFIGKHFGTGVILSTAFVHLLQEGFESLNDPSLSGKWKDFTGFIVLISFLAIFLVEYVSTAYVERMSQSYGHHHHEHYHHHHHHHPSDAEHMTIEPYHDEPLTEALLDIESSDNYSEPPAAVIVDGRRSSVVDERRSSVVDERRSSVVDERRSSVVDERRSSDDDNRISRSWKRKSLVIGHHRHESPSEHHHKVGPRLEQRQHIPVLYIPEGAFHESSGHARTRTEEEREVSRKTRIIGILVLQLGIMIHSLVIGLTLSITEGANFTTLLTAILFHQLFEGLSLGIRISTLPSGSRRSRLLPPILCFFFAITAPLGLLLGMGLLPSADERVSSTPDGSSEAQIGLLTRGLMCALSAGMLIYAGCVEMLAGDFVMSSEMRQLSIRKQALGLTSLVLGTVAMGIIGIWS